MKINWNYIKLLVLVSLIVFLFAFAYHRNSVRRVSNPNIEFIGEAMPFITSQNVSKLLIQKFKGVNNVTKETLDLNALESVLKSNPMIKSAEVYMSINGTLTAEIEQKTPIARVFTNASYYIDADGFYMPLSSNYAARVPLVTGNVQKNNLKGIYKVANKIKDDTFLKKHVIEIHRGQDSMIYLKLRQCPFLVKVGSAKNLDKKMNNLKAFYKKNLEEKTLGSYSKVNLQFDNQVVCTKI